MKLQDIEQEIILGFIGVKEKDPLFRAVRLIVDQHLQQWTHQSVAPDRTNEQRQHDSGRVGALSDIVRALDHYQHKANRVEGG